MSSSKFQINLRLSDFKESGLEVLKLVVVLQYTICEEDGEYIPITEDHDPRWSEKRRFKQGEEFPDERGWMWVGE